MIDPFLEILQTRASAKNLDVPLHLSILSY